MQYLIFLSFLPAILSLIFFSIFIKQFSFLKGLIAFALGLCAIVPITVIQFATVNIPLFSGATLGSLFATTFIFNGFIEETTKGALLIFVPKKKYVAEDAILPFFLCCLISGLATGGFESVIYLLKKMQENAFSSSDAAFSMIIVRMFTAVLLHGFCAGLSGISLFQKRLLPFVFAIFLHGAYNFFAGLAFPFWTFSIVALLFAILECRIQSKN